MSEKFDQLKIMQEMFPNATFVDANGERVADTSKTLDHIAGVSKKVSLTEQWKKGELEDGEYYIKSNKEDIYIDICANGSFMFTNYRSIEEVLAPVPSFEQWQSLNELLDSMRDTNKALAHRLNICKELLIECNLLLIKQQANDEVEHKESAELVLRIEEVLK